MKSQALFFLLLLTCMNPSLAQVFSACCLVYSRIAIPIRNIESYRIQEIGICNMRAVIFQTKTKKLLCANPDDRWVQERIGTLDMRNES